LAKTAIGSTPFLAGDFARFDCPLRQQPGDDVHDPRGYLQRLAGKSDSGKRFEHRALIPAGIVEVRTRFVGEEHRLGIKRVDQARRDPHLRLRNV
jgi:hypothetical protein